MTNAYEKRLIRVVEHIHDHPDGDLSLDALADVAALSRFHFHRIWTAMTGEPLAQTIRRVRLYKAAAELVKGHAPLAQVAAECGYRDQSAFTRAFRQAFGLTPGDYRKRGRAIPPTWQQRLERSDMRQVEIREIAPRRLAGIPHRGDYMTVGVAFEKAGAAFAARGAFGQVRGMAGLYYDAPGSVPLKDQRALAGFVVTDEFEATPPLDGAEIPGGRFAVLTVTGPYTGLAAAYDWLFGPWLAQSGETPREEPVLELYLNTPMEVAPDALVTEIQIPLTPR